MKSLSHQSTQKIIVSAHFFNKDKSGQNIVEFIICAKCQSPDTLIDIVKSPDFLNFDN